VISRREFLGTSLGAGAALALTPDLLHALQQAGGQLIQRPIKFDEVRRYQIAESAGWAHPAVSSNSIIVKDADKVICWHF
jgi:hypothetical protein